MSTEKRAETRRHSNRERLVGRKALLVLLLASAISAPARAVDPADLTGSHPPLPPDGGVARALRLGGELAGSARFDPPEQIEVFFDREDFELDASSLAVFLDDVEVTEQLEWSYGRASLPWPSPQRRGPDIGPHSIEVSVLDAQGLEHALSETFTVYANPCPGGCPWPFSPSADAHVVSNLMEDYQTFSGGKYWHGGIDIRVPAGTPVLSISDGIVRQVINYDSPKPAFWQVTVEGSDGFIWQYHHLVASSIPVSVGQNVLAGDPLGDVYSWSWSMNGFVYHHLHLNAVRWLGGGAVPGPYVDGFLHYNPLRFLRKGSYVDAIDPKAFEMYFSANESNVATAASSDPLTPNLAGDIDIIAQLRDRMTSITPANGQPYELGIYDLSYSIEPVNNPCLGNVPRTWLGRFDELPGGTVISNQNFALKEIFKESFSYDGTTHLTTFNEVDQQLFYVLTNSHMGLPNGPQGFWDTDATNQLGARFGDGLYRVTLYARDIHGNETTSSADVQLINGLEFLGICPERLRDFIWVHPFEFIKPFGPTQSFTPPALALAFEPTQAGVATATLDSTQWPAWNIDLDEQGLRVAIGLLENDTATLRYWPELGDLDLIADVDVQLIPLGAGRAATGSFDPGAAPSQPLRLRLTTRLAREPQTGAALIGRSVLATGASPVLVGALEIDVDGETWLLRAPGNAIQWTVASTAVPALEVLPGVGALVLFLALAAWRLRGARIAGPRERAN